MNPRAAAASNELPDMHRCAAFVNGDTGLTVARGGTEAARAHSEVGASSTGIRAEHKLLPVSVAAHASSADLDRLRGAVNTCQQPLPQALPIGVPCCTIEHAVRRVFR